jgi:15-cis-phytoene synthase
MLDSGYIHRAAPPGSMRYFAQLYAPIDRRELLNALLVVETEIRGLTSHAAHEVAHTRLQWWRAEVDRLVNRNAQHPAMRVIQQARPDLDGSILHEVLVAADMDLARMTFNTLDELNAYLVRSGAALRLYSAPAFEELGKLGALIRRVETVRDLVMEARAGRVYWALDELQARRITVEDLRDGKLSSQMRQLLADEIARLLAEFDRVLESLAGRELRPLCVLGALHARLLRRIARTNCDVFTRRHDLGAFEKVWTAWRAARQS